MANDVARKTTGRKAPTAPAKAAKTAAKAPAKTARKTAAKKTTVPDLGGPPPGWYPTVDDPTHLRYWDGRGWDHDLGTVPADEELPAGAASSTQPAAEGDTATGAGAAAGTITFRGRVMKVTRPTEDQLALWQRISTRAQAFTRQDMTPKPCPDCQGTGVVGADESRCETCAGSGDANVRGALRLFNQTMNIITSVLVDEVDKDWLEDQLVEGKIDLLDASDVLTLTVSALITSRRQTAPRHGPAPKARRRK